MTTVKLSEEARKAALARARKAGPLPAAVRRELVRLYQQQGGLTARLASFVDWEEPASGWVLGHLVTELAEHLRDGLRVVPEPAGATAREVLRRSAAVLPGGPAEAARILLEGRTAGAGSRRANRALVDLLRILDLGVLGHPVLAAVMAREIHGLADVSTALVAGAGMTVETAVEVAASLDVPVVVARSATDRLERWLLPSELLTPDDAQALGLVAFGNGPLAGGARDIDAVDEHPNQG